ncbi:hypothetical protein BGZ73_003997 [Actinomortierella ambigua]|nr:hypothetical protein BGZ73_003997 [Actinomortierella ambigua]
MANPKLYLEHCLSAGEEATSVGFFKFTKASFAHLGSLSDTWKQFITTVEPAALRSVMMDKTGTVAVVDKRYRDLIEQELRSDSVSSTSTHDGDENQSDVTCPQDEGGNASTHRTKRRKNSTAVDEAMKLFEDSPLFDFFAYIFKKAQGNRHNPLPRVPSTEMSPNIRRLALYAQSELSKSSNSEQDLKNLYVVLSCIVSLQIPNATELFGKELVLKIEKEVRFEGFERSRIDGFLSRLRDTFSHSLDVKHLMDEISLRLAGIVNQERDGRDVDKETLELERVALEIIRYFCILIVGKQFELRLSETTCVAYWNYVWTILFGGTDLVFDMGELASSATKADMHAIEILFGSLSQTGGRKTDTLVRVQQVTTGVGTLYECAVNEHKPMHASPSALSHQSSKLLRINRSILGQTGSMDTVAFIDAHGLTGTIYGMKAIEDIFGARALGTIALPTNKYELHDFLQGDSLTMLFRYKVATHVSLCQCLYGTQGPGEALATRSLLSANAQLSFTHTTTFAGFRSLVQSAKSDVISQ